MDRTLESIASLLRQKKWTLSVAESCTGGLVAASITDSPGVSDFFVGGLVAYANSLKIQILKVPESIISNEGAVSESTVLHMARGAQKAFNSDCSISISGVAGPTGGSSRTPVGSVWMAAKGPDFEVAKLYQFSGNRAEVREQSVEKSLELLLSLLANTSSQKK